MEFPNRDLIHQNLLTRYEVPLTIIYMEVTCVHRVANHAKDISGGELLRDDTPTTDNKQLITDSLGVWQTNVYFDRPANSSFTNNRNDKSSKASKVYEPRQGQITLLIQ